MNICLKPIFTTLTCECMPDSNREFVLDSYSIKNKCISKACHCKILLYLNHGDRKTDRILTFARPAGKGGMIRNAAGRLSNLYLFTGING